MGQGPQPPEFAMPIRERITALLHPLEPLVTHVPRRIERIPGIRAALFDVYGTMLISGTGDVGTASAVENAVAAREALACAGFEGRLDEAGEAAGTWLSEEIRKVHEEKKREGVNYPEVEIREAWCAVIARLVHAGLLQTEATASRVQHLAVEYELRVNPVWPMPNLTETLEGLQARGVALGIVSNAQFYTPLLFEALLGGAPDALGFDQDLCLWSWECGEAKPSIVLFEEMEQSLARTLNLESESALYVGNDMLNDISTASRCGFRTALFAGDQRSLRMREDDPRCEGLRPDVIITRLTDLLDVVE